MMPSGITIPDLRPDTPAASSAGLPFEVLRKRAQFLAAAKGRRAHVTGFVIQGLRRDDGDARIGVGFTCSKKVGNAVARNRAKRRLREIARAVLPFHAHPGWDYVLIGRADVTGTRPMPDLIADLNEALVKLHPSQRPKPTPSAP